MKHLPDKTIHALHEAAIRSGLSRSRTALFSGLDPLVVAGIPIENNPSAQLIADLMDLNQIALDDDGTVPLVDWLRNALLLVGPRSESRVFRQALEVLSMNQGIARSPVPAASPDGWGPGKRCFIGHAQEDEGFARDLRRHLGSLVHGGLLSLWSPSALIAGQSLNVIPQRLDEAEIALFLVSSDLFASAEAMSWVELAVKRARSGLQLIPILVRPVDYAGTLLEEFTPLPSTREPIISFRLPDDAYTDIARSLRARLAMGAPPPLVMQPAVVAVELHRIDDLFSAGPSSALTYVPPREIDQLSEEMLRMGRALVVQGPSGTGKTTAMRALVPDERCWINCQSAEERSRLTALIGTARSAGHLVLDELQELDASSWRLLANAIKLSADRRGTSAKITLISVDDAGTRLFEANPNLMGRYDVIEMKQRQPRAKLLELMEKGEQAANVRFAQKDALALAARGSFSLTKQLCLKALAGQKETAPRTRIVGESIDVLIDAVRASMMGFRSRIVQFARLGDAYLALLWKLSTLVEDDDVSLDEVKHDFPELGDSLDAIVSRGFPADHPLAPYLRINERGRVFCVDMQLIFYVANTRERDWLTIGQDAGFSAYFQKGVMRFGRRGPDGAQVVRHGILDLDAPDFYARIEAQELLALLVSAYPDADRIRVIAGRAGVGLGDVSFAGGARSIWHDLAGASITAGTFRALVSTILRDSFVAAYHTRIQRLISA